MSKLSWLLALLAAALLGGPLLGVDPGADARAGARADDEPGPRCNKCRHLGRVPCKQHRRKGEHALEEGVMYCSEYAGCEACAGAAWLDCDACENLPAQAWLAARRASQAALAPTMEHYDSEMGRPLQKAKSEHFILVWDIESLKVDKQRLNAHELNHLYLERLEALYDDYCAVLQASDADFTEDFEVFVWWLPKDQLDASRRFCMDGSERGMKLMGSNPAYSVCGSRKFYKGDTELYRNLVHSVTHLILSHQKPADWMGNKKGGWADGGLAHFFEERVFSICDNYCYQEQDTNQDFKGGKWKPAVRKMVALDEAPPAAGVFAQNTDTLTLEQHAVAFSYVDFLIQLDGAKTNRLFQRLRAKVATRDALKETFGFAPLEFERQWKEWVLATYPTR